MLLVLINSIMRTFVRRENVLASSHFATLPMKNFTRYSNSRDLTFAKTMIFFRKPLLVLVRLHGGGADNEAVVMLECAFSSQ